jgi:hypothetical protein
VKVRLFQKTEYILRNCTFLRHGEHASAHSASVFMQSSRGTRTYVRLC